MLAAVLGASLVLQSSEKEENTVAISSTPVPSAQITEKIVTDFNASFAIFTFGTFRIFTDEKYHHQSGEVFIQADNPNIIHVKNQGVTWDDFFRTLPFKLTKDCLATGTGQTFCTNSNGKLSFYLNSIEDPDALDKFFNKGDKLLVTYGNENKEQIQLQLQKVPSSE